MGDWEIPGRPSDQSGDLEEWHRQHQKQVQQQRDQVTARLVNLAKDGDVEEEVDFQPGQLVLRKNHVLSNKLEGIHAGLAPKWLGPFEVDKKLGHGVYALKTNPPVKVHAAELRAIPQPLRSNEESPREESPREESEDIRPEAPRYNLRCRH